MFRIQNVIRGIEMFYLCIGLTSSGGICKFSDAYYGEHFVTKNLFAYLISYWKSFQFNLLSKFKLTEWNWSAFEIFCEVFKT